MASRVWTIFMPEEEYYPVKDMIRFCMNPEEFDYWIPNLQDFIHFRSSSDMYSEKYRVRAVASGKDGQMYCTVKRCSK